jgi:hypothetical protein
MFTIEKMFEGITKSVKAINTEDLSDYLSMYQAEKRGRTDVFLD